VIVTSNSRQPDQGELAALRTVSPRPGHALGSTGDHRHGPTTEGDHAAAEDGPVAVVAGPALAIGVAGPALAATGSALERKCGSQGTWDGQFSGLSGVPTDASGNHRIRKFSSTGDFIAKWGSRWNGDPGSDGISNSTARPGMSRRTLRAMSTSPTARPQPAVSPASRTQNTTGQAVQAAAPR
jgi:hypothetical protein